MIKFNNNVHEGVHMPYQSKYMDIYFKLSKSRILFINEDFSDKMAADVTAMLLYLDNQESEYPIEIYINSNGGAVSALTNIYDVMQMIKSPIKTICIGKSYSAGAFLLSSGTKGMRYAFKNSSIMIHGVQFILPPGQGVADSKTYLSFVEHNNNNLMKILSRNTGHSLSKVKDDCKSDVWLTAEQALSYNLIDYII